MKYLKRSNLILLSFLLIAFTTPVHSFAFTLPDTGQELCYDWDKTICDEWHMEGPVQVCDSTPYCPDEGEDFYGQDAHYTLNPPDLTDNGDGTITDHLTGLMWEQKTEENEALSYTYSDALTYCDELALAGHQDWRAPTREEFSTVLNFGRVSPALDIMYFPLYTYANPYEVYYWTTSTYHDDASQVWRMLISFGLIENGPIESSLHKIRCVRGNPLPAPSYTDNGDGTVTDDATGLMWEQKTQDGGSRDKDITYTWKDALAYCESLLLGGHDDWRLPNAKELDRLVDLNTSNPAIDTTYFPNTNNTLYWTSTSCTKCHHRKAFAIDFSDGELYYGNKLKDEVYYENYTRCVRTADASSTTTTAPATTTTASPQPCPVETIYGEGSDEVQLLRHFRDTRLSKTPEGQELIKVYYEFSPVIVEAMKEDKQLGKDIKEMLDKMIQMINAG